METELAQALKKLNVRLLVAESAIDAMFSLAAKSPELRQALSDEFADQVEGLEDGLAGTADADTLHMLQASCRRFEEALRPPSQ